LSAVTTLSDIAMNSHNGTAEEVANDAALALGKIALEMDIAQVEAEGEKGKDDVNENPGEDTEDNPGAAAHFTLVAFNTLADMGKILMSSTSTDMTDECTINSNCTTHFNPERLRYAATASSILAKIAITATGKKISEKAVAELSAAMEQLAGILPKDSEKAIESEKAIGGDRDVESNDNKNDNDANNVNKNGNDADENGTYSHVNIKKPKQQTSNDAKNGPRISIIQMQKTATTTPTKGLQKFLNYVYKALAAVAIHARNKSAVKAGTRAIGNVVLEGVESAGALLTDIALNTEDEEVLFLYQYR
jgi:hypothetical protein